MGIKCRRGSVLWRDICDFFFVFSAENCSALSVWCVRFHVERERMFLFERSRLFLEEFLSAFLSRRRRCPFFSQKENKQSSFLSFASLSVFCFFSFVRFTQERLAF